MPVYVFPHVPFINKSFKTQLLEKLLWKVEELWADSDEFVAIVSNVAIQGKFVDAILISNNTICVFTLLDYGGRIEARKTGNWRASGRPIIGTNSYDLLDTNIKLVYDAIYRIIPIAGIQGIALFSKPITYVEQAALITDNWFHVSDLAGFRKDGAYISQNSTRLNQHNINKILVQLGVSADLLPKIKDNIPPLPASKAEDKKSTSEKIIVLFASAQRCFESKNFSLTIEKLTQLEELTLNHAGMYYLRGVARYELSYYREALTDLDTTLSIDSGQSDAYFYRAMVWQELKNIKEALKDFDRAIVLAPYKEEYYQKYGEYLYTTGNFRAAIANFNRHISLRSDAAIAYYNRGCAYQQVHNNSEAIADYEMALRLDPAMEPAKEALEKLKMPLKADTGKKHYEEGLLKQQSDDHNGAIKCFSLAILSAPGLAEAYHKRATSYVTTKQNKLALDDFEVAISLSPNPIVFFDRGQLLLSLKSYEAACNDFTKVLTHYTAYPEAFYFRGKCNYELNRLQEAVQDFETVVRLAADNHLAHFYLGLIKLNHFKKYQESETHFTDALDHKPDFAEAYYQRGLSRFKRAKYKIAAQDFDAAINLGFTQDNIILRRAEARVEIGNHVGAIKDYSTCINRGNKERAVLFSRGRSKQITADYQGAIKDFTVALNSKIGDVHVDNSQLYYYRAHAYKSLKRIAEAIENFTIAISYGLTNGDVYYFRGSCYDTTGKLQEAEADFFKATQLSPANADAVNKLLLVREKIAKKKAATTINRERKNSISQQKNVENKPKTPAEQANDLFLVGLNNQQKSFYFEAITHYNRAIEIYPENTKFYHQRGVCWFELGSVDRALADFTKALSIEPSYAEPKGFVKKINEIKARESYAKAVNLGKEGKHKEAIFFYDSAIATSLQNKIYYNNRGNAKGAVGDFYGAINDFNTAISIDPYYSKAYNNRGAVWQKLRELARAVDDFSKAVQIDPSYTVANENLKKAMFLLGKEMQ